MARSNRKSDRGTRGNPFKRRALAELIRLAFAASAAAGAMPGVAAIIDCPPNNIVAPTTLVKSPVTLTGGEHCTIASGGDLVFRPGGSLSIDATPSRLTLESGGSATNLDTLTNAGTITNSGTLSNGGYMEVTLVPGVLTNTGKLEILSGGRLHNEMTSQLTNDLGGSLVNNWDLNNFGTLTNVGSLENAADGILSNKSSGTLTNTGSLNSQYRLENDGVLTNSGTLATLTNSYRLLNGGLLTNEAGATLNNDGPFPDGGLVNQGTIINAGVLNNTGALYNSGGCACAPEATIVNTGTLNNSGDLLNLGTLSNEVVGTTVGTLNNSGALVNFGSLTNAGKLNNEADGSLYNYAGMKNELTGKITNSGKLYNGKYLSFADATLVNEGRIINKSGGEIYNYGSLSNTGKIINKSDGHIHNYGVLTNETGGKIVNKDGALLENTNLLTNNGTIFNAGTIVNTAFGLYVGLYNNGSLKNTGKIINDGGRVLNGSNYYGINATLTNSGKLINKNYGGLYNESQIVNKAAGKIINQYGSHIYNQSASATITNEGTIINKGQFLNRDGALLTNSGTLVNTAGADLRVLGGASLSNSGTLKNAYSYYGSGRIRVDKTSAFTNTGTVINAGNIDNQGAITNAGIFKVESTGKVEGFYGKFTQTAGVTTVNGTMEQAEININGGRLQGNGTLIGARDEIGNVLGKITVAEGAVVAPGNSIGTMTWNVGDVGTDFDGILEIEIGSETSYDIFDVQGRGGIRFGSHAFFNFLLDSGITIDDGVVDGFLLAQFVSGFRRDMCRITAGWGCELINDTAEGDIDLHFFRLATGNAPEPGTALLLSLGIGWLGFSRWRRKQGLAAASQP